MRAWGITAIFFSLSSFAQTIPLFVHESVGTLPQGRFMISYLALNASVDSMYGRDGRAQTLSNALHQSIRFQKIAEQDAPRTEQMKGLFESNGVSLDDTAGNLSGSIRGVVNGKVPVIGYGISDRIGTYASIPVLNFQIFSDYQFQQSGSSRAFVQTLRSNDQNSVADEFEAAYQKSLETKLYQSQYYWDPRLNRNYLGDIQIQMIYLIARADRSPFRDSVQPILVLPTANDQDIHDLFGLRAGDRRWGLGLRYSGEYRLSRWKLNGSLQTMHLFPTTTSRRIVKDESDEVKEYTDPSVSIQGGQKWESQLQIQYEWKSWIAAVAGLHYQQKFQEDWSGAPFTPSQYEWSSRDSAYELFSSFMGVEINSIPSFLAGGFWIPMIADLGVGLPISGRNAIAEPVIQLQGSVFF